MRQKSRGTKCSTSEGKGGQAGDWEIRLSVVAQREENKEPVEN